MMRKIAPLVLVLVVFSAGCLVQTGGKTASSSFALNTTYIPSKAEVPVNVTAIAINVTVNFIGYKNITFTQVYPVVLVNVGPDVVNVTSSFRLSDNTYAVPGYLFDRLNNVNTLIVGLVLQNGSAPGLKIEFSGTPTKVVDMVVNYDVEKNGTHYIVRPIGWSLKRITLWNETFNVTVELPEPIQIANAPTVEFKNDILPEVCKTTEGDVTIIYKYSIGDVYLVGPAGKSFVGIIYFPCEKMAGK